MEYNTLRLKKSKQRVRTFFGEKDGLSDAVTALLFTPDALYIGTQSGLFSCRNGKINAVYENIPSVTGLFSDAENLYVSSENVLYIIKSDKIVEKIVFEQKIIGVVRDGDGTIWLMTVQQLYRFSDGEFRFANEPEFPSNAVCAQNGGVLFAAGNKSLLTLRGKRMMWGNMLYGRTRMPEDNFRCLACDSYGHIWVGGEKGLYVFDGRSEWLSHAQIPMLPEAPITTITFGQNGSTYIGTAIGLYILNENGSSFLGAEGWIPDSYVTAFAVSEDENEMWIGTKKGLSRILLVEMSLEEKAAHYEEHVRKYDVREDYVVARDLSEEKNIDSGDVQISDNDGLWTALYLVAESFRYRVTGDENAREYARKSMNALLKLETITGIEGYTARCYRRPGEPDFGNGDSEWKKAVDEKGELEWRGETSSDEMVGHFFAADWYYDLCADEDEKKTLAEAMKKITDHILTHNYTLWDVDNEPTTWAHWSPDELNHDDCWVWEKGINSLELLAFLGVTHKMTGEQKYRDVYLSLIEKHHYAMNCMRYKAFDGHCCHIDDRLGFYTITLLMRYETDPGLLRYYGMGLRQHFEDERLEGNPTWNFFYGALTGEHCDLDAAVRTLQNFPLDLIRYKMKNSIRPDIETTEEACAFGGIVQAKYAIPVEERAVDRMADNPFDLDGGSNMESLAPTTWLLPYWFARYYGLIEE